MSLDPHVKADLVGCPKGLLADPGKFRAYSEFRGGGSGGVQSTGVSQRVRATGKGRVPEVFPPQKNPFKNKGFRAPIF